MGIYIDLQCLCRSLDDNIVLRGNRNFAPFLGLDRDDRMEGTVFIRCIISVGMRDDGFREILLDRRTVSEVPGE